MLTRIASRLQGLLFASVAFTFGASAAESAAPSAAATPPPPIAIVTARPVKLIYDIGEKITAEVTLKNSSDQPQAVTVRGWLEWDIDARGKPQSAKLTVAPKSTDRAAFVFPAPKTKYGHAFKAEVLLGDTVAARGEDFFNVCDNYWNVALINAVGFMWDAYDAKMMPTADMAWADNYVKRFREGYYNGFEHFFWGEDDFLGLTPKVDVWYSGQARYRGAQSVLHAIIDKAHAQGMKAITYAKLTGGGTYGAEMARRHPEWVWQDNGTLAVERGVESLAKWDDPTIKQLPQSWVATNYNMNDPAVVDIGIRELGNSAVMFGWDGARWDGNFDVRSEVYDLDGKLVEKLSGDQVDARNAANMRRTKDAITRRLPRFVYGYNWTQGNWLQTMATTPRESLELCRGGGLIMNEYINQAESVQHPLHRWDVYAPSVADDVEAIKKLGGYYGPILGSPDSADGLYTNVFAYAAGAHPYYHHHFGAFMTRYSAFCWDNALRRIHTPENIVLVGGGVWWRNWVFERTTDDGRHQLVVHLINPPAKPTVGEGKKLEDLPPPRRDVEVRVFPALLDGWRPVRAAQLSPRPAVAAPVAVVESEGAYGLKVPEVALWTILVIDLQKGGR